MSIFEDLKDSLNQAIEIQRSGKEAAKVSRFEVADAKAIRAALNVSQIEFAQALGTSVDTIKSWETKRRNPTGLAAKVLATIKDNPSFYKVLSTHKTA